MPLNPAFKPPSISVSPKSDMGQIPFTSARQNGTLPLQQRISSASEIPTSSRQPPHSSHVASMQYVEQCQRILERSREVHAEERALWQLERAELHARIGELELALRRMRSTTSSDESTTSASTHGQSDMARSAFGNYRLPQSSSRTSASTGDEYWRGAGGKVDAHPRRAFSDESSIHASGDHKMPSIAENGRPMMESNRTREDSSHHASVDGAAIDKNLDGIMFKPSAVPDVVIRSLQNSASPSPLRSPSPSRSVPAPLDLSGSRRLAPEELLTKDAGNTPIATRRSHLRDSAASPTSSDILTPTTAKPDLSVRAPRPSIAPRPGEHSDTYFPPGDLAVDDDVLEEYEDTDPALKGPLSLQDPNGVDDRSFLSELNSKLEHVAKSRDISPAREHLSPPVVESSKENTKKSTGGDDAGEDFDEPEPEVRLKIKRSMNFGSQFGSSSFGTKF
ncbi:hypothetical protein MMC25_001659 [Agyrium rufum]|nr:hypothetical protein [Agyrium rufum]